MSFGPFAATIAFACFLSAAVTTFAQNPKPAPVPEPPPTEADWELPAAHLRDNGLRGDVVLNAWWKGKPTDAETYTRVRVPDYGYSLRRKDYTYQRDFVVPERWNGRRLSVEMGNFSEAGVVYFDGKEAARLNAKSRYHELPITDQAKGGGRHTIRIVAGVIGDDVILRSFPASAAAIDESYITTSTRRSDVTLELSGTGTPGEALTIRASIWSDADQAHLAKAMKSVPITVGPDGRWKTLLREPWPDAKRWSQWSPNLYWYTAEVLQDGEAMDRLLPRRFGFREVWIEGRQVMLNGVPVHFMGDNWPSQTGTWSSMPQLAEAVIRNARAMGITSGYRTDSTHVLEKCDELGMLVSYMYLGALDIPVERMVVGADQAGDAGGDVDQVVQEKLEASKARLLRWMRKYREHPSVLSWTARAPWQRGTLNSLLVGRIEDPWNYWPGNHELEKRKAQFAAADENIKFIRQYDPYRPVTAQNSPLADIELATRYLCDNLDLQEREQFFEDYARSDSTKILWSSEHGIPFQGHQFLRKQAHQQPQGGAYPAIHLENAARLFGERVYLEEPDLRLKQWHRWSDSGHRTSPVFQQIVAENATFVHRGWRTAGVSAHCHWVARDGFEINTKLKTLEERWGVSNGVDPRQPGVSKWSTSPVFPSLKTDTVLPAGEAYMRSIAPLVVYIGGAESPGRKDHLYYSGAMLRKRAIVLNDYDTDVTVTGRWELVGADGLIAQQGDLNATVKAGERAIDRLPLQVQLPEVRTRTTYTLRVTLDAKERGTLRDQFDVTVFPAPAPAVSVSSNVWLPKGAEDNRVTNALREHQAARLIESPDAIGEHDVVVIPRNYLASDSGLAELQRLNLDGLVRRGVRVIVFEQDLPNILGLATEDVRPRRAFISAAGHPVFDGLADSDLTYWTGASDLQPAAEAMPESDRFRFPERIWQVSNDNAVATRTLVRPQVGASRALAVSGFDLAETPLLESAIGRGRLIVSTFDVSNRYGLCPVATRLVDNLISYAATVDAPDPQRARIEIVPPSASEARPNLYRAQKPSGQDGWGMTNAEFFFRESIYASNWITKKPPQVAVNVFPGQGTEGLPQVVRRDDDRFVTTLSPEQFQTGWQKRKIEFIHAAMRINLGGSADIGPGIRLHGDASPLYPHKWLEGFINPYTAACW